MIGMRRNLTMDRQSHVQSIVSKNILGMGSAMRCACQKLATLMVVTVTVNSNSLWLSVVINVFVFR